MIIGVMSYPNAYVFMSFHPPAFLIKLNIEMSMAELILKIARSKKDRTAEQSFELSQWTYGDREDSGYSPSAPPLSLTQRSRNKHTRVSSLDDEDDEVETTPAPKIAVVRTAEVTVDIESLKEARFKEGQRGFQDHNGPVDFDTIGRDGDAETGTFGHGRRSSQRIGHRAEVSSSTSQTELKNAAAPFGS